MRFGETHCLSCGEDEEQHSVCLVFCHRLSCGDGDDDGRKKGKKGKKEKGKKTKNNKKKVRHEQSTVVEDEEERWNQKIKNRRNNINTEREKKEYTKQMTHQLKDQLPQ